MEKIFGLVGGGGLFFIFFLAALAASNHGIRLVVHVVDEFGIKFFKI